MFLVRQLWAPATKPCDGCACAASLRVSRTGCGLLGRRCGQLAHLSLPHRPATPLPLCSCLASPAHGSPSLDLSVTGRRRSLLPRFGHRSKTLTLCFKGFVGSKTDCRTRDLPLYSLKSLRQKSRTLLCQNNRALDEAAFQFQLVARTPREDATACILRPSLIADERCRSHVPNL